MKVAFVGKGGAGKTALSSLFVRYLANRGLPVVAIDADINQHLAVALGMSEEAAATLPPLGAYMTELKEYLRGSNPLIASAEEMTKTTPAGSGSRLLQVLGDDPFHTTYARHFNGATLLATGPFGQDDLGVACYHSKTGAVELYLNHLVDDRGEYVIVDMTAGADSFASGLFSRFDVTFLIVEPTRKGVSVYEQYRDYAENFGIKLCVVGNKIQNQEDIGFLRDRVGRHLLATMGESRFIRRLDQGKPLGFESLEGEALATLGVLHREVDATPKDWGKFQEQAIAIHLRNAAAWANERTGVNLAMQVDPTFHIGPAALAG